MKRSSPSRNPEYNSLAMDEEDPTGDFAAMSMDEGNPSPHPTSSTNNMNINNNMSIQQRKKNGLREQLHEFKVMSMPYFQENRNGRILFAIMVVLTLANSAVRVFFSYLARDFWSALSDKKVEEFYKIMTKFVGSMFILAPINVLYGYQRQKLAIAWRKWLTGRVLRLYFSNKVS